MASLIYTGPNDKKLGLRSHQIFSGDLPQHVADALKAIPSLSNHFMPFDAFVKGKPPGAPKVSNVQAPVRRQEPPIKKY